MIRRDREERGRREAGRNLFIAFSGDLEKILDVRNSCCIWKTNLLYIDVQFFKGMPRAQFVCLKSYVYTV